MTHRPSIGLAWVISLSVAFHSHTKKPILLTLESNGLVFFCFRQMKRDAPVEQCWFIATLAFPVRRPSPSLTWCVTPSWAWWKPTRWSNNVVQSSRQISTLWANCWNLNKDWDDHRMAMTAPSMAPINRPAARTVHSPLAVTCVIYRLRAGRPTVTNPLQKWSPAVVSNHI